MHQGNDLRTHVGSFLARARGLAASSALVVGLAASTALAVHPGHWVHNSEADYDPGVKDNTLVTNLGDIKLAAQTQTLGKMPEDASVIYDMRALANGDVYIAAGPEAKVLRRRNGKIEQVVALKGEQVFALNEFDGKLLVAVSSGADHTRLALLADDKLTDLVSLPGTRYVWDLAVKDKAIYLATGVKGKVLKVDTAAKDDKNMPKVSTLLETPQANLLCLTLDKQGRIFAGSDTDGLVYRVTEQANGKVESFVAFDAPEPEIGAILAASDGNIYIGTADAEQARPGRLEAPSTGESGRPATEPAPPAKPPIAPPPVKPLPEPPKPTPKTGDAPPATPQAIPKDGPPVGDFEETGQTPKPKPATPAPQAVAGQPEPSSLADTPAAQPKPKDSADQAGAENPAPTPEQQDQLRQIIRQRLEAARRTGQLQVGGGGNGGPRPRRPAAGGGPPMGGPGRPQQAGAKPGNAIYRIDPNGIVTEVYRESMMVLRLAEFNGKLLVATGNQGHVYSIDPNAEENALLVNVEPQQVSALLAGPDGQVILGTSNPATLISLSRDQAKEGKFTSIVLDAGQISLWGKVNVTGSIPTGSTVDVETRSGNVQDPDKAPWSPWMPAKTLTPDDNKLALSPMEAAIASPPARFLQYRLTLKHQGELAAPVVKKVEMTFVVPNLRPVINSIQASYPGTPPPTPSGNPATPQPMQRPGAGRQMGPGGGPEAGPVTAMNIEWEAADPNNDQLVYTLEYKPAGGDVWLPLAKDLKENRFEWQTKRVPDGRYVIRVTASDLPDNTPDMALAAKRVSDPVLVDNTPPALDFKTEGGKGNAKITGAAKDELSIVQSIYYAVDSTDTWQYILPANGIYDSTNEEFAVTIPDLAAGQHVITVRAIDARGNVQHKAMFVEVK